MKSRSWLGIVGLGAALLSAAGCKSSTQPSAATGDKPIEAAKPAPQTPPDPATLGDITGIVRFAGKAPAPIKIDTSMDPACSFSQSGDVYSEQYVVKGDRLANVYVYIKSGPGIVGASDQTPVVLDQKGCVYTPHVIAVQVGQPVEFHNSDSTMHNVHTMPMDDSGNAPVDISQGPKGRPQVERFNKPEIMMPVRCNNHPWMNAFINVSAYPWFAVTSEDGKFSLKGMPAGEYVLGAVHEKLGEQEVKVTVKPKGATQSDVTFAIK